MKRSEMVKIIFEYLTDPVLIHALTFEGIGQGAVDIECHAKHLLNAMEDEGMLPPKSLDTVCLKKRLVRGYTLMFEWEEE